MPASPSPSPNSSPRLLPKKLFKAPPQNARPNSIQHSTSSDSTSTIQGRSSFSSISMSLTPSDSTLRPEYLRPRGHSISNFRSPSPGRDGAPASSRATSVPPKLNSRLSRSSSTIRPPFPPSSWRTSGFGSETPLHGEPGSWWGAAQDALGLGERRPWEDEKHFPSPPKRKNTVSKEQSEGWIHTKNRVAQAASSILGNTADVAHEALVLGADVLRFAPIVGLSEAARVLLSIWDSLQLVDLNRLACLRLTERCADILISVREEVAEAGDEVGEELKGPIAKLVESFLHVQQFLLKQAHRPFLKRYLKRDEILKQISGCDKELNECLEMFGLSIQIRILKQVQRAARSQADNQALLSSLLHSSGIASPPASSSHPPPLGLPTPSPGPSKNTLELTGVPTSSSPHIGSLPTLTTSPTTSTSTSTHPTPSTILPTIQALQTVQNVSDAAHDIQDLRSLMRAALSAGSDLEMIEVLQVGREEMPEAIKTLQRALERVGDGGEGSGIVSGLEVALGKGVEEKEGKRKERSETILSKDSRGSSGSGGSAGKRDTLDREFIESGIDALRRLSLTTGEVETLPSWTITRYEVDREEKIGMGFFSDVYRGTWRSYTVAIKVLSPSTPKSLFVHEVEIWRELNHPNVLELFGASSASGEPPWFFVSRFCGGGSLVSWLRGVGEVEWAVAVGGGGGGGGGKGSKKERVDLLRMMHEVAKGMEYLHRAGVLHGDLKAANVLVDDKIRGDRPRCVISDFGQSEMKSEAYRLSGTPPPHGTLRWQAPELMSGISQLTTEADVYAFAISCVEILTKGSLPWPMMDDDAVRHFVLKENSRPSLPLTRISSPALAVLLRACWHHDPFQRPPFSRIVTDIKRLRVTSGSDMEESPKPRLSEIAESHMSRRSPDMHPYPLPGATSENDAGQFSPSTSSSESYNTAPIETPTSPQTGGLAISTSPGGPSYIIPGRRTEDTGTGLGLIQMPQPVIYTPSIYSASSIFTSTVEDSEEDGFDLEQLDLWEGYDSPPPVNERHAGLRNERRYRLLLTHEFHPSLTLPLWTPTSVALGAVGYLSKPSGEFIILFNSFDPAKSSDGVARNLPSLYGYGRVTQDSQRQDKRSVAQRSLDAISGLLTFKKQDDGSFSRNVSRRYSFPLRAGHKTAYLCTESTMYRYIENLEAPKLWFKSNVDSIMQMFGQAHRIQKEDLFLVIGTLDAPDYALFVSHNHPDGQGHFNVFSSPKAGQAWGTFTTDTEFPEDFRGPSYHEEVPGNPLSASKVSTVGSNKWDTLLLARLRFKPDVLEPTSL